MAITPYIFSQGVAGGFHAASGNITVTLPAFGTDHIGLIYCCQHDNVVCTITAGWTILLPTNSGANARAFVAYRRMVAGDANPVITHAAGNSIIAQVVIIAGCRTAGNAYEALSALANAASTTVTTTAITPATANDLIVFIAAGADDSTYSAYSGTNPTFAELTDDLTGDALDSSIALAYGTKTDTTTTGARTATQSRTIENVGFLFAFVGTGTDEFPDYLLADAPIVRQAVQRAAYY